MAVVSHCLTSLSLIISKSIHVVANAIISFLFMALFHSFLWLSNIPLCTCTTASLAIPVDGHFGCFHGKDLIIDMSIRNIAELALSSLKLLISSLFLLI